MQCSFAKWKVPSATSESSLPFVPSGVGFWGFEAVGGTCFSYVFDGAGVGSPPHDTAYAVARAFTGIADAIGGLAMASLWSSVCFPSPTATYRKVGCVLLFAMACDACSMAILASSVCRPDFFDYAVPGMGEALGTGAGCTFGGGMMYAAIACAFWLFAGLSCIMVGPPRDDNEDTVVASEGLENRQVSATGELGDAGEDYYGE